MNRGESLRLAQELSRPAGLQTPHPEPRRELVEVAGIEPASVNPPHTGDYMFSLSTV